MSARADERQQRQLLDEMFSGTGMRIYSRMPEGSTSPTEIERVPGKLASSKCNAGDGNWGISIAVGEGTAASAADVADVLDWADLLPEGVEKVLCLDDRNILDGAEFHLDEFLSCGGKLIYSESPRFPGAEVPSSMFDYNGHASWNMSPMRYLGPVRGKLREALRMRVADELSYRKTDDVTAEYAECGADIPMDELPLVTDILSYGKCSLTPPGNILWELAELEFPMEIAGEKAVRDELAEEYGELFGDAMAVAKIWRHYTDKYAFSPFGYGEASYRKWAEMGELLGIRETVEMHFGHGIPVKDILA